MQDYKRDSDYSTGWEPVTRINENEGTTGSNIENKFKHLSDKFERIRKELEGKVDAVSSERDTVRCGLLFKISKLEENLLKKEELIKDMTEEKALLQEKYSALETKYDDLEKENNCLMKQYKALLEEKYILELESSKLLQQIEDSKIKKRKGLFSSLI